MRDVSVLRGKTALTDDELESALRAYKEAYDAVDRLGPHFAMAAEAIQRDYYSFLLMARARNWGVNGERPSPINA